MDAMNCLRFSVVLCITVFVFACKGPPMKTGDWTSRDGHQATAVVDELRAALRKFEIDDSSGNPERVANWYIEDAIWQPVGSPAVIGKQAIQERYARSFADSTIHVTICEEAVSVRGSVASVSGHTNVAITPRAGGTTTNIVDRFVMLMRKESNQWKITALAWESDPCGDP